MPSLVLTADVRLLSHVSLRRMIFCFLYPLTSLYTVPTFMSSLRRFLDRHVPFGGRTYLSYISEM